METSFIIVQHSLSILERISNFNKLKRITAWILHFANKCRRRQETYQPFLSVLELSIAENYLLKVAQQVVFQEEIVLLECGKLLSRKSKLLSLHPFLDEQGLMRLGGRICRSEMPYTKRHPLVLPGSHTVTKLIALDSTFSVLAWIMLDQC